MYFVGTGLLISIFVLVRCCSWRIYNVNNIIQLYFVNDKLFNNCCDGEFPDGIAIDFNMNLAMELDPELTYEDWEEDYQFPKGYWLENNINDNTLMFISIFIKQALDDDLVR